MNTLNRIIRSSLLAVAGYTLVFVVSFFVSFFLREQLDGFLGANEFLKVGIVQLFFVALAIYLLSHLIVAQAVSRINYSSRLSYIYAIYQVATFSFFLLFVIGAFKLILVSRFFVGILYVTTLLLSMIYIRAMNVTIFRLRALRFKRDKVLLIGPEDNNCSTRAALLDFGKDIKILDLPIMGKTIDFNENFIAKVVGSLLDEEIRDIYISQSFNHLHELEKLLIICDSLDVRVFVSSDQVSPDRAQTMLGGRSNFSSTAVSNFTCLSNTIHTSFGLKIKKMLDIFYSSVFLLVASPVFIIVPILIKLESKGPVFFKQNRVGRNGKKFTMFKFRSMVDNAEQLKDSMGLSQRNQLSGPAFKMFEDPRVTKVGKFLRKYSLDELPQLLNVLMGQMSIVGPRPPLQSEVEQYEFWHFRRLSVSPGITGLWQINGRNRIRDFNEWVRLDIQYINNWSFWLDIKIMFKTIGVVLTTKGAA
jgi:exopolysaccharide biosynthesis polyprenyl glycosylphosphotransferase